MSKRYRRRPLPPPASSVSVDSLAHDGRGVARIDGKAVFIDGALPGEVVDFEYTRVCRKYDEGRVTSIQQASPDRVVPRCAHFGVCGGCSLQHLSPAAQVRAKQQTLLDNLTHIGKVEPETVLPPLTGPVWGYRGKGRLGVKDVVKKGRVLVGFREKRSPYVADLLRCEVLHPAIGGQLQALAARLQQLEARARIPQVEVAVAGETVALVFRHLDPLSAQDLAALRGYAAETGMHVYLQPGGPDSVELLAPEESVLAYSLPAESIEIVFQPTDFTQVNTAINEQMVAQVLALLEPGASEQVLDLFCGLGNFTLPLARHSASVTGVEGDTGLVRRARDNALRNGLDNVTFYSADLAGSVDGASWTTSGYDKVLLDPPRSGAAAVMPLLGNIGAQRIVYVSCHPGSLARDAGTLVREYGYRLCAAGVMDMFPHTAHVESIALFERG